MCVDEGAIAPTLSILNAYIAASGGTEVLGLMRSSAELVSQRVQYSHGSCLVGLMTWGPGRRQGPPDIVVNI